MIYLIGGCAVLLFLLFLGVCVLCHELGRIADCAHSLVMAEERREARERVLFPEAS